MRHLFSAAAVLFLTCTAALASDWPTYMHDNARSGVTDETLTPPLAEQWTYRPPAALHPAWPDPQSTDERNKLKFDDAFYTVAADNSIYFGSSVDHQVYAIDATTGRIRWRFFTGAPIRLAPTFDKGKVYVGSDDGKVYCLAADDGHVVWEFNAAPEARQVLGNGSIISLWPVRTGVMVDGDRLFFAGGIFPYHSPALYSLKTATGEVIPWKDLKPKLLTLFAPQGYLIRTPRAVVAPCGRNNPFVADPESGNPIAKLVPDRQATGGGGGSYGVVVDDTFYFGSQIALFGSDINTGAIKSNWFYVLKVVATPDTCYVINVPSIPRFKKPNTPAEFVGVTAFDRAEQTQADAKTAATAAVRPTAAPPAKILWRYEHADVVSIVLAGKHLIAGCKNEVVFLNAADGKEVWKTKVDGDAVGLTVANGRLLVSTTTGAIYCFAVGAPSKTAVVNFIYAPRADGVDTLAEGLVRESGVTRGYAVVTGRGAAELAIELARQTELNVTCLEEDAQQLIASRARVNAKGLYGSRVTVLPANQDRWPYPDFIANLVVNLDAKDKSAFSPEMIRVLKPCGGVLMLPSAPTADALTASAKTGVWSQNLAVTPKSAWAKLVRGELEGSGWWTHTIADAGNSGSSGDQIIKDGNLAVLWFGEPGAGEAIDRHRRQMTPLACNGRIYFQGWGNLERKSSIICFDAYNGVRYWEREIPGAIRLQIPAVAGNLACNDDSLFVVAGSKCERLDAITGKTLMTYETPRGEDGKNPAWGYVAVSNGILFGSATTPTPASFQDSRFINASGVQHLGARFSGSVFAFDIASGKQAWIQRGKEIRDSTIVIADGRLFFTENTGPATVLPARSPDGGMFWHKGDDGSDGKPDKADKADKTVIDRLGKTVEVPPAEPLIRTVRALDAATGKIIWQKDVDLADCGVWGASASTREAAGYREIQALCKNDVLLFAACFNQHDGADPEDLRRRKAVALSPKDGSEIWAHAVGNKNRPIILRDSLLAGDVMRNLRTGEPLEKHDLKTGKSVPWAVLNGGSCGTPSASEGVVFYRKGSTAWRGIDDGIGAQFLGIRPGCSTNILPVGGVVVQPEASSGCSCAFSVQCTITFAPSGKPAAVADVKGK